jgi:hypothetical protein
LERRSDVTTRPDDYLVEPLKHHVRIESPNALTQRSVLTIFLVAGLFMSLAIGFLMSATLHLTHVQHASDQERNDQAARTLANSYKGRSIVCAGLAVQVGRRALPATCLEKPVLGFYNPAAVNTAVSASTAATQVLGLKNRAATCEGLYALGVRFKPGNTCVSKPVLAYWDPNNLTAFKS